MAERGAWCQHFRGLGMGCEASWWVVVGEGQECPVVHNLRPTN